MFFKNRPDSGFSLLELLAVLSIMAIFAAAVVPNFVKKIDDAKYEAEVKLMEDMVDAYLSYVGKNGGIPATSDSPEITTWDRAIAIELNVPSEKIKANSTGYPRYYVWEEPDLSIKPMLGSLPYIQTVQNASNIVLNPGERRPRVMIISSIFKDISTTTVNGAVDKATFDLLWNWTGSADILGLSAEDARASVVIGRIDFQRAISDVTLLNDISNKIVTEFFNAGASAAARRRVLQATLNLEIVGVTVGSSTVGGNPDTYSLSVNNNQNILISNVRSGMSGSWAGSYRFISAADGVDLTLSASTPTANNWMTVEMWLRGYPHYSIRSGDPLTQLNTASPFRLSLLNGTRLILYGHWPRDLIKEVIIRESQDLKYKVSPGNSWE